MSEDKQQQTVPYISSYLPAEMYIRAYLMAQTANVFDAIKRLCDLGMIEYVDIILSNIVHTRGPIAGSIHPVYEFPVSCITIDQRDKNGSYYIFLKTVTGGRENLYCVNIYEVLDAQSNKYYFIRPCSKSETDSLTQEAEKALMKPPAMDEARKTRMPGDFITGFVEPEEINVIPANELTQSRTRRKHAKKNTDNADTDNVDAD